MVEMIATKSIKGRICYLDSCTSCFKDKGFVPKSYIGRICKSCSNSLKAKGRTAWNKGIKTGMPAWNRSEHFLNKDKRNLRDRMSRRMRHALDRRKLSKNWQGIFKMLGYNVEDLYKNIESKFKDNMSWKNRDEWQIDHIIPESYFNYSNIEDEAFKKCWALDNLQPLWTEDNLRKSNKILTGGGLFQ